MIAKDSKGLKQDISKELQNVSSMTPKNDADREALKEITGMLKKYAK